MSEPYFPTTDAERSAFEELRSRMNVGRLIVRWRVKFGLTQEQLAKRSGTKQSRISEVETLGGNLQFDTLDRISRALGLEITLQLRDHISTQWQGLAGPTEWTVAAPSAVSITSGIGTPTTERTIQVLTGSSK